MPRRPGPSLTRADVLDAALRVLDAQGADALGTGTVAAVLGIRPPSIYHHFPGNDALRHAVAVEGWRRLLATLPPPTGGLPDALRQLAAGYRDFARAHPGLYRVMTSTAFDPADAGLLEVTARAAEALGAGGVDPADAIHAVRGLRAAVHGFVDLELSGQLRLAVPSADASFAWLVDLVIRGIEAERR